MANVTRRSFVTSGGASTVPPTALLAEGVGTQGVKPPAGGVMPDAAAVDRPAYLFFTAQEALFIEAACERLIPENELGAGALAAGVPRYLDGQLGGAWGAGEHLYRSGPWHVGTPSQGYQLPHTPAELFRACKRAIGWQLAAQGTPFHEMSDARQDAYLTALESGGTDLDDVPSAEFFDLLLRMTVEGFFTVPPTAATRTWWPGA